MSKPGRAAERANGGLHRVAASQQLGHELGREEPRRARDAGDAGGHIYWGKEVGPYFEYLGMGFVSEISEISILNYLKLVVWIAIISLQPNYSACPACTILRSSLAHELQDASLRLAPGTAVRRDGARDASERSDDAPSRGSCIITFDLRPLKRRKPSKLNLSKQL